METIALPAYEPFLAKLREVSIDDPSSTDEFLNGLAAAHLRDLVPLTQRRKIGAFFTPSELADRVAAPLTDHSGDANVLDPTCGAGDLLLGAQRAMASAIRSGKVAATFSGVDVVGQFAEACERRLRLQATVLGVQTPTAIEVADARTHRPAESTTHLLMNPPFGPAEPPKQCGWASGSVNAAAVILDTTLRRVSGGVRVRAILPDVLRSGSRYAKWRRNIEQLMTVDSIEPAGQFDRWTDVHVFILDGLTVSDVSESEAPTHPWVATHDGDVVSKHFDASVGAVVHYRHPEAGEPKPYLTTHGFELWGDVRNFPVTRRFQGRLHKPPFVVVGRTSRPGERPRARAAVVPRGNPVAVDNHLIVLHPKDGTVGRCRELLGLLRRPSTDAWLDEHMQCRHLTLGAVTSIPWGT